jgi:hypothetical protein
VAGAVDLNDDGLADVLLTAPDAGIEGEAYVYFGPIAGDLTSRDHDAKWTAQYRNALSGGLAAGDVDGDGRADVAAGAPVWKAVGDGAVFLTCDPLAGGILDREADVRIVGEDDAGFGDTLALGDLDDDGYADLVVGADRADAVYVFYGPLPAGEHDAGDADGILETEVYALAVPGDLTGDGRPDLAVGDPSDPGTEAGGIVRIYSRLLRGTIPYDAAAATIGGDGTVEDEAGYALAAAGDADGDGLPDLLSGGPARDDWDGAAWLIPGW